MGIITKNKTELRKINEKEKFMAVKNLNNVLVLLIIVLSIIASAYGFFSDNIVYENKTIETINGESVSLYGKGLYYNDSVSLAAQARAQDIITLIIGIPILIISLFLSNRNSIRGKLLLTGTVGYFLYTYASYSFFMMYNKFFLIYVALMSLSLICFIINISSQELKNLEKHYKQNFPRKYIGIFTIIMGIIICLLWLSLIIPSIKKAPDVLEHYSTLVIQAMDLGFIFPLAVISGILLIKNKSLGYLLSSIVIIKGFTLTLAIVMMIVFMFFAGVNVDIIEIVIFTSFSIVCIINLYIIQKNIISEKQTRL